MITRTKTKWKPKGIVFAVADQLRQWSEMEKHLGLVPGAENISLTRVTDGTIEGIRFSVAGFEFALFNSLLWEPDKPAEFWFFVWNNEAPENVLQELVNHFEALLK